MFKTKCGCPYCKNEAIPYARGQWKSRSNKHGRAYGLHCKGTHRRGSRRGW